MELNQIKSQFTPYLKEGEMICWTGKPLGGWRLRELDMILLPMTIILCGFTALLDYIIVDFGSNWLIKGFALMLTCACFYMAFYRFYKDKLRRERTEYCLTNRRLLVLHGGSHKHKVHIIAVKDIKHAVLNEEKKGYGHIVFNNNNPVFSWLFGSFVFATTNVPGLEMIENAQSVYALFKKIQEEMDQKLAGVGPN